jgi:hypothetical protein
MLSYPMHGFAKRVEDAVFRAMTILQNREDRAQKWPLSLATHKPQRRGVKGSE